MTENKRFYIQGVGIADRERKRLYDLKTVDGFISVRDLLNGQEDKINRLKKSRDKWEALAENFNAFYNCYEKAINEVCDQKTIEKIETAYAEHEKQVELK